MNCFVEYDTIHGSAEVNVYLLFEDLQIIIQTEMSQIKQLDLYTVNCRKTSISLQSRVSRLIYLLSLAKAGAPFAHSVMRFNEA